MQVLVCVRVSQYRFNDIRFTVGSLFGSSAHRLIFRHPKYSWTFHQTTAGAASPTPQRWNLTRESRSNPRSPRARVQHGDARFVISRAPSKKTNQGSKVPKYTGIHNKAHAQRKLKKINQTGDLKCDTNTQNITSSAAGMRVKICFLFYLNK